MSWSRRHGASVVARLDEVPQWESRVWHNNQKVFVQLDCPPFQTSYGEGTFSQLTIFCKGCYQHVSSILQVGFNTIIRIEEHLPRADKSAVGAINRPLL